MEKKAKSVILAWQGPGFGFVGGAKEHVGLTTRQNCGSLRGSPVLDCSCYW